jgi:aminopeptidase-like protein
MTAQTIPMPRLTLDDANIAAATRGAAMHALVRELYPFQRSITGAGLRATVKRLGQIVPLEVTEVPSGTRVFDWQVPNEWTIDEAFLEDEQGRRIVDMGSCNLHVVGYSTPVDAVLALEELRPHLHSIPERPDWIPYRTAYYAPAWGFCLADRVLKTLPEGHYRAVIRSRVAPGSLTLAEHLHSGATADEVLVFAHDCHPSLANDNLSGVAVAINLAEYLKTRTTRYSYRFVFAPATIGSITWLTTHPAVLPRVRHGLVLSLLGGTGPFHYKKSRHGSHAIDRTAARVLRAAHPDTRVLDFSPWGYDERQFCSPGVNLPMGRLTRTPNGEFPEYHTSADNPDFITGDQLGEAWLACLRIFSALETDRRYINLQPHGEPQLGKRGLYRTTGGQQQVPERQLALLWVLNQSDGIVSLPDIAEQAGLPLALMAEAAADLKRAGLLAEAP